MAAYMYLQKLPVEYQNLKTNTSKITCNGICGVKWSCTHHVNTKK